TQMPFMQTLREFADQARNKVGEVRSELHDLAMQEMPSDRIAKFMDEVKAKAQEAAEAAVQVQGAIGSGTFESPNEQEEKEREKLAKELERQREGLQAKLDQIVEFSLAEDELEQARHKERLQTIRDALDAELMTEEEYNILKQRLEEEHIARINQIRQKGWTDRQKFQNKSLSQQVKDVTGDLAGITAGVARENKAMFEINKIAGIANAIVSAYEGIALTMSKYPYPLNIGLAAAHAVA